MSQTPMYKLTKRPLIHTIPQKMVGFTLVELMISVVIGLVTTLVIAEVLLFSESQKRTTTSGSDAQVNGAQAIYAIQRDLKMAGYGFSSVPALLGCPIRAKYNGVDIATGAATPKFPTLLAPVIIDSTDTSRNVVRVLSSSKVGYAIPVQISAPGYVPSGAGTGSFPVLSALGVKSGDLMVAAKFDASTCEAFSVTADPTDTLIDRTDVPGGWNANLFPASSYSFGDYLINLGGVVSHTYSISAAYNLQLTRFSITSPATTATPTDIYSDIVILQALYGKDTDGDGTVDTYDRVTPTTVTGWQQVRAVRLALVARSGQREKEVVTASNPNWDVGSTATVDVSPAPSTCGSSKCISLKVDGVAYSNPIDGTDEWKHYRYKVFDTIVPIVNMLWSS